MTLKQMDGETPEEFQARKEAFAKEQASKIENDEDYKNLHSFATKARNNEITLAKKLAEKDPKEILGLDKETQNKVIKELYGYENLKELEIMLPDVFEEGDNTSQNNNGEFKSEDAYQELLRQQKLTQHKLEQKEVEDEYEKFMSANEQIVKSIPDFKQKFEEELWNISSKLPASERVQRATKIVSSGLNLDVEAFLALQGRTIKKAPAWAVSQETISKNTEILREKLGLKKKDK